jgi:hypothetical protein
MDRRMRLYVEDPVATLHDSSAANASSTLWFWESAHRSSWIGDASHGFKS